MRVWCRLWCWQLCAFWWKRFLVIQGNATAAQEAAHGRIGFSLFQGAGRAGCRWNVWKITDPQQRWARPTTPLNFTSSVSTLWEKHDFVVNNGAKLPKTTHCKHCKNLSYSVTSPNWERLKTVPGMSSRQMMKMGHCLCQPNRPFYCWGDVNSQCLILTETVGCITKPINYEKEDPCSHADEPHHQFWKAKQWTTIKPVVFCHLVDNMARRGDKTQWWWWSFLKCVID